MFRFHYEIYPTSAIFFNGLENGHLSSHGSLVSLPSFTMEADYKPKISNSILRIGEPCVLPSGTLLWEICFKSNWDILIWYLLIQICPDDLGVSSIVTLVSCFFFFVLINAQTIVIHMSIQSYLSFFVKLKQDCIANLAIKCFCKDLTWFSSLKLFSISLYKKYCYKSFSV